mmetsp:Transcript_55769/g.124577  ORF Transcript_55769/g.124577 Transcript_55769/m.124577 type:complete len:213 (-) Transcript_55769:13-651(-)
MRRLGWRTSSRGHTLRLTCSTTSHPRIRWHRNALRACTPTCFKLSQGTVISTTSCSSGHRWWRRWSRVQRHLLLSRLRCVVSLIMVMLGHSSACSRRPRQRRGCWSSRSSYTTSTHSTPPKLPFAGWVPVLEGRPWILRTQKMDPGRVHDGGEVPSSSWRVRCRYNRTYPYSRVCCLVDLATIVPLRYSLRVTGPGITATVITDPPERLHGM